METTATQAAFYLPILKYLLIYTASIVGVVIIMGIAYMAAILFPYAKDR